MFGAIVIFLFIVSFTLAVKSVRKIGEKPSVGDVKKSLDKHRVIFQTHSSK